MDLERTRKSFRLQAGICDHLGSPFYAGLLRRAQEDLEAEGPVHALVRDWQGDPLRGFLPLRVLGAVHARVLAGSAPALAAYYPTAGGRADAAAAWPHLRDVIGSQREQLRPRLDRAPQTNEVRRCAGLLPGFLLVARDWKRPLRLLEIGCSAGLNLQWSRYRYDLECWRWGSPEAGVEIRSRWIGDPPPLADVAVEIAERRGCDVAPRSLADDEAVRELECFVWADQPERLAQLRAAIAVARSDPPKLERARAGDWLPDRLAEDDAGVGCVVYHSSVWTYIDPAEQTRLRRVLGERGAVASEARPLAWLRAEDSADGTRIELRLRTWPGGREVRLGEAHPHGRRVVWRPEEVDPS